MYAVYTRTLCSIYTEYVRVRNLRIVYTAVLVQCMYSRMGLYRGRVVACSLLGAGLLHKAQWMGGRLHALFHVYHSTRMYNVRDHHGSSL